MAGNLDNFNMPDLFPGIRQLQNAREYLSANIDSLLDARKWDSMYNSDIVSVTHLILRFALLDRLADAFGFPREPTLTSTTRRVLPHEVTKEFVKVCCFLADSKCC
jgi:hypothetical protein